MYKIMLLSLIAVFSCCGQLHGQQANSSPQVTLPKPYDSIIATAGSLVASATSTLKTGRSDARELAIKAALTRRLSSGFDPKSPLYLDKTDTDPLLSEKALLCGVRLNYIARAVDLNYLTSLVQSLSSVSKPASPPTDVVGALKLLLATSSYSISSGTQVKPLPDLQSAAKAACEADLNAYEKDYYGDKTPGIAGPQSAAQEEASLSLGFLGPIGSLIDTFTAIIQPILIDASMIVDEARRQQVIEGALRDPKIRPKLEASGKALALAVDSYAASSKHVLTGEFVEQLVAIRELTVDLSKETECVGLATKVRLPSGAPSAAFVSCWQAAWSHLEPMVKSLNTIGDGYDNLADAGTVSAAKLLGTIMADYAQIDSDQSDVSNVFWDDVTQFIALANAINTAASKSNIVALQKGAAAVGH